MEKIKSIVEQCLIEMSKEEFFMMIPDDIPDEMLDKSIEPSEGYQGWKPINSIIDDNDLDKVESKIGHKLPQSYREFLKYKHWFGLRIPDHAVNFPDHKPDKELSFLSEKVFEYMEPELIIGKGYIYFADFEDYGILCFDTNHEKENDEYRIVYINHEDLDDIHLYANSFTELLEADEEAGNRFIDKLNSYYE
ncbi:SMI1/KNR4 family protein [Flammeovirga sp. EKP202]|uniref:SMI1/KNR4 family protein n=1 Tax=Flammeovirga sp. EKP202 TaxID=2770592 RepID=UPI00165F6B69|nr:SMI1/KNR4 family protein [Flammeovirga sp. EKP202]MBD0400586.1 SMI1/KNR4 family protein [Flammeovirga sp. EKP202]